MLNAEVAKRRDDAISRGVGMMTQIYADRALNSRSLGYRGQPLYRLCRRHRRGQHRALPPQGDGGGRNQMTKFTHTCHQVLPYENYIRLAERLNDAGAGRLAEEDRSS